jgi:hypothetical protein
VSWWTKIVRPVATVALRGVAAVYTGGASEALLAATGRSALGISSFLPKQAAEEAGTMIVDQAAQRYPNVAALVSVAQGARNVVRDYRATGRDPDTGESFDTYGDEDDYDDEEY